MISIMVVEDQAMLREALVSLINAQADMRVVSDIGQAKDALKTLERQGADLVLMDVLTEPAAAPFDREGAAFPTGIHAASSIRKKYPGVKVVIMTAFPEITFQGAARAAGAHSFVYKSTGNEKLLAVIRDTMKGKSIYPESLPVELPFKVDFSHREIQVLRLFCQGKTRPEAARELHISEASIKAVITALLNKTGFDSIMRLAVFAVANGYIAPNG
jgi:DNA-binding NarL/FixJ family response regulator